MLNVCCDYLFFLYNEKFITLTQNIIVVFCCCFENELPALLSAT